MEINKAYKVALGTVPDGVRAIMDGARTFQDMILHVQGGLLLVQAILNVADPEARQKAYVEQFSRLGAMAGGTEVGKGLGWFVSGATSMIGAGGYALATVMKQPQLAQDLLRIAGQALGNLNIALNGLGVLHGTFVLFNSKSTTTEKVAGFVEIASGGLGLAARRWPSFAMQSAALSGSVLITYYSFKTIIEEAAQSYLSLIAYALGRCYQDMQETARDIDATASKLATALQLQEVENDPGIRDELDRQVEALRVRLVDLFLKPYLARCLAQGADEDPGTYEPLRQRFQAMGAAKFDTDQQIFDGVARFIEIVLGCIADAQEILWASAKTAMRDNG